ncbi:hypothetical protein QU39_00110, partial [Staphylococcus aureus]
FEIGLDIAGEDDLLDAEIPVLGEAAIDVARAVFIQRPPDRVAVERGIGGAVTAHAQAVVQIRVEDIGPEIGEREVLVRERRAAKGGAAVGVADVAGTEQDAVDRSQADIARDVRLAEDLRVTGLLGEGDAADLPP